MGPTLLTGPDIGGAASALFENLVAGYNAAQRALPGVLPNFRESLDPGEQKQWYETDIKTPEGKAYVAAATKAFEKDRVFTGIDEEGDEVSATARDLLQAVLVKQGLGDTDENGKIRISERGSNVFDNVYRRLTGQPYDRTDGEAIAYGDMLLEEMRSYTPDHAKQVNPAVTYAKDEEWRKEEAAGGRVADFRMGSNAKVNYNAQRTYDLLRAFEGGRHTPDFATTGSKVQQAIGATTYPIVGRVTTIADDTPSRTLSDTYRQINQIAGNSLYRGGLGKAQNALINYQNAAVGLGRDMIQDPGEGAYFPRHSSMSQEGMGSKFFDMTNRYAQFLKPFRDTLFHPSQILSGLGGELFTAAKDLKRAVPRIPNGMMAQRAADARDTQEDVDLYAENYINDTYPMLFHRFNQAFGTKLKPTFLSPAAQIVASMPQEVLGDPTTFATLPLSFMMPTLARGVGLARTAGKMASPRMADLANEFLDQVGKAAMDSLKQAGKDIGEELKYELPLATATMNSESQADGDSRPFLERMFTPQQFSNMVVDDLGEPARADDPNYPQYYNNAANQYKRDLDEVYGYVQDTEQYRPKPKWSPYSGKLPPSSPPGKVNPWTMKVSPRRPFD